MPNQNTQFKYNFLRIKYIYNEIDTHLKLLNNNINSKGIINFQSCDPLLYLILENLIDNLIKSKLNQNDLNQLENISTKLKQSLQKDLIINENIIEPIRNIIKQNDLIIQNLTVYIMAQKPSLKNYKKSMQQYLIDLFGQDLLKYTCIHAGTGEKIGKTGRCEAIDVHIVSNISKSNKQELIGYGFDRHRLQSNPSKELILGGCTFTLPENLSIVSHSDGDLLLHSLTDAILSAFGQSDIGDFFSDTDQSNFKRNSLEFVNFALDFALSENYKIQNINLTLFANELIKQELNQQNATRLISENLANILNIDQANVKSKIELSSQGCISKGEGLESQVFISFAK